jgi:hypothetical protein
MAKLRFVPIHRRGVCKTNAPKWLIAGLLRPFICAVATGPILPARRPVRYSCVSALCNRGAEPPSQHSCR